MKKNNFISLTETNILKGVALIFMYIHHMFTYPGMYIDGISYPSLETFVQIFRHPFNPVSIFCFITGYTSVFSKNKTLNKILNILEPIYLIILLIIVTAYLIDSTYNPFLYFRF